jgi:hypothetical protein
VHLAIYILASCGVKRGTWKSAAREEELLQGKFGRGCLRQIPRRYLFLASASVVPSSSTRPQGINIGFQLDTGTDVRLSHWHHPQVALALWCFFFLVVFHETTRNKLSLEQFDARCAPYQNNNQRLKTSKYKSNTPCYNSNDECITTYYTCQLRNMNYHYM